MLPQEQITRLGLETDMDVDSVMIDEIAVRKQLPAARKDTERYLVGSEHSISQLRIYLLNRNYLERVTGETVDWAERCGLVDDKRYASIYLRSHCNNSPMGSFRLRIELRHRGISDEIINNVLEERDDNDLFEVLVHTVKSRYAHLDREIAFRRGVGYMKRRGFNSDLIMRVIKEAFDNSGEFPD